MSHIFRSDQKIRQKNSSNLYIKAAKSFFNVPTERKIVAEAACGKGVLYLHNIFCATENL
jgi:hypothetical protein